MLKFKWFIETETHKEEKKISISTNQKEIHIQNLKNYHQSVRKKITADSKLAVE